MEKNEIKKMLYKQNPSAKLSFIRKGKVYYTATIIVDGESDSESFNVTFEIPVDDMGEADFFTIMESKYLNRWIYEISKIEFSPSV